MSVAAAIHNHFTTIIYCQGSLVKSGNDPPPQNEEITQDKEIADALQSSGICHELLLHRNGYQANRQISSGEEIIILLNIAPTYLTDVHLCGCYVKWGGGVMLYIL